MALYKLHNIPKSDGTTFQDVIYNNGSRSYSIPFDLANADYQEYLEWKAAGNTPEAAD